MDKKMKIAYAGLMLVLMVGASLGTVVAETMDYALLTGNAELAAAASSASTIGGILAILSVVNPAFALVSAGYFATTGVVYL